ncbi:MAG: polyhydroxyalkanoate synthesis repressor PhaR [Alphaproteobacteria bacterium]
MTGEKQQDGDVITIKKYANRRLYNTATSSYVTLDDLCQMVKAKNEFVVYDAKSGEDITRAVLTQIIVEEESKGQNLLPIGFLRQLISYYGDSLSGLVPRYLDHSMNSFSSNQDQMRTYLQDAFDGLFPFGSLEDMSKQNVALMEKAMQMFTPFADAPKPSAPREKPARPAAGENQPSSTDSQLDALMRKIEDLQDQVENLSAKKAPK